MATKTLRVFAEYTSTGFVPMPTAGNIDYGYTLGSTFPATTPTSFQTDNPDLVVTVSAMTDFYVWIRINGILLILVMFVYIPIRLTLTMWL